VFWRVTDGWKEDPPAEELEAREAL
jgi:hypothetical protein